MYKRFITLVLLAGFQVKVAILFLIIYSANSYGLPFSYTIQNSPNPEVEAAITGAMGQYFPLKNSSRPTRLEFIWSNNFDADSKTLANASSHKTSTPYSAVRDKLILKNPELSKILPAGNSIPVYRDGVIEHYDKITVSNANYYALDINCCAYQWGSLHSESTITINGNYDWSLTSSDSGQDLQRVLSHEIGHALGFESSVDSDSPQQPTVLDLFRYSDQSIQTGKEAGLGPIPDLSKDDRPKYAFDWSNSNIEDCINGSSGKFSFCGEIEFSHGVGTDDNRQASHFLDDKYFDSGAKPFPAICDFNFCFDAVTQSYVTNGNSYVPTRQSTNVMDPTNGRSDINSLAGGDYWIFDLLGYEFEAPPFTLSSLGGMSGGYEVIGDNKCLQFDGHLCTRTAWDDPNWEPSIDSEPYSSTIPEPSIIALFALGLVGIGFARRRQS